MAELDIELNQPSESETRINQLSKRISLTTEERDAEKQAREAAEAKTSEIERERDFYAGFADVIATNPQAKDHKDDILAKVKSGYTVEDATFAVLGKAGKLGAPTAVAVETTIAAGGSATNGITQTGEKTIGEMSQAERRSELEKILDIA